MKKKFALTILEIMVVIFIIGIIGGVVAINMRGSLEQGKAFKSEKGSKQVHDLLSFELAQNPSSKEKLTNVQDVIALLENSGIAQDGEKLMRDGWGEYYQVRLVKGELIVKSSKYIDYLKDKKNMKKEQIEKEYSWMFPPKKQST